MRNDLLISDVILKERTAIHGNIDPKLLYPCLKVSQDKYILPLLGSALYSKLQDLIADNTINEAENEDYKNLLEIYIIDTLIWFALSELPIGISFQFWNKGVTRKVGLDTESPSMSELFDISNHYRQTAEFYGNRLKKYLQQNANEKYREYNSPGNGIDTIGPNNDAFQIGIWLGPDCGCRSTDGFPPNNNCYE